MDLVDTGLGLPGTAWSGFVRARRDNVDRVGKEKGCVDPVNGRVASDPPREITLLLFNKGTCCWADMFDGADRGNNFISAVSVPVTVSSASVPERALSVWCVC